VKAGDQLLLAREDFQALLDALSERGYRVVGPTPRDGAIVYDEIRSVADLPAGWTDEQEAGTYRLKRRDDAALFGYVVGPHSWKKFLFLPELLLWKAERTPDGFSTADPLPDQTSLAFLGVRSCELHAIAIQDKVFMPVDPVYRARRERVFVVAVNCGLAGRTCFCVSMKTGPRATAGFDLALTELIDGARHEFLVEVGSERGADVLAGVPNRLATPPERAEGERVSERATSQMGRAMETADIKGLLYRNYDNPRWDDVARRCLTCANCTMVCPTCFCSTVEDVTDLTGEHAERWRKWDSCFTMDFSFIHGGSVRPSVKSRYRQWMTHKLATWIDQFGTSGCVGCGRCITWCPVGIDITEEVRAIRESEKRHEDH
jgi:formate hydrogenlyase subunit 6/NADH:ubiquinone oxidoreductase subunit I